MKVVSCRVISCERSCGKLCGYDGKGEGDGGYFVKGNGKESREGFWILDRVDGLVGLSLTREVMRGDVLEVDVGRVFSVWVSLIRWHHIHATNAPFFFSREPEG